MSAIQRLSSRLSPLALNCTYAFHSKLPSSINTISRRLISTSSRLSSTPHVSRPVRSSVGLGAVLVATPYLLQQNVNHSAEEVPAATPSAVNALTPDLKSTSSPIISSNNTSSSDHSTEHYLQHGSNELHFESGVCIIPHPAKRHKGGEDAYFLSGDRKTIGVADGVGGWAEVGVDPSEYSRSLMEGARLSADAATLPHERDPVEIMCEAYRYASQVKGSSTCCIVTLDGCYLSTANLGDSGFMVVRGSEIVFRTKEQQHSFNFPYQLGTGSSDLPEHADHYSIPVQEGDLVILGSDGLWDNLYDHEVVDVVEKSAGDPVKTAQMIARRAFLVGNSKTILSPFARSAQEAGYLFTLGGKLDDITVLVSKITFKSSTDSTPTPSPFILSPDTPSTNEGSSSLVYEEVTSQDEMDHEPTTVVISNL
eukprot:TRINITY_DN1159_c0_g1_i1.p1 TRINITY_DN1159_c0_g1~~TRINITY_DN1159_c0_g1_i1.p1  ORF type:complete len:424 (-),score=96.15 TRINITY_DN1159_c0_g1_i1:138-1409(-)